MQYRAIRLGTYSVAMLVIAFSRCMFAADTIPATVTSVGTSASSSVVPTSAVDLASLANTEGISELVTSFVRSSIPEKYENYKQWGMKKQIWDGLKVALDDGQIKTKRRWKEVNHGSWKQYQAWPINPNEELHVRIANIREQRAGVVGADVECVAHVGAFGRWSEWRRGIQLFSVSADAEAQIRMLISLEVGSRLDLTHFPPDIVLLPKATKADIQLVDFRLLRVSDVGGIAAHELGESLEGILRNEVREQGDKVVDKINRQVEKKQDKLKFSPKLWPLTGSKESGPTTDGSTSETTEKPQ